MRTPCLKQMIELSMSSPMFGPFVRAATEVGVVVPSILESNLKQAGYTVNYKPGAQHGAWVLVTQDSATAYDEENEHIVARAFSHDRGDALLQAVYAEMKCGR